MTAPALPHPRPARPATATATAVRCPGLAGPHYQLCDTLEQAAALAENWHSFYGGVGVAVVTIRITEVGDA